METKRFYQYEYVDNSGNLKADLSIEFRNAVDTHYSFNGWTSGKPLPMFAENTIDIERALSGIYCSYIDLSSWNTKKIKNISGLCSFSNFTELDLSGLDLSNCEYYDCLFNGCKYLEDLDFSNQNPTSKGMNNRFFWNCNSLKLLDISGWKNQISLQKALKDVRFSDSLKYVYMYDKTVAKIMEMHIPQGCTIYCLQ